MENSEKIILILTLTYIHIIKQKLFSLGGAVKIKILVTLLWTMRDKVKEKVKARFKIKVKVIKVIK